MPSKPRLIPIYTSSGDTGGFLVYPYLFNMLGQWMGWVNPDRKVYSVRGRCVGILTDDPRIIKKKEWGYDEPRKTPPKPPEPITIPAHLPLAPFLPELASNMIDVLDDEPDLLPAIDFGDVGEDMD